jgi:hypothetical protein
VGATLRALEKYGVTLDHLTRLRAEDAYAKRVAEFMLRGGLEGSVHQKLARAIMGKNFFGIEDWSALYGVNFSQKQLRAIAEFPWGANILNSPCPFHKGNTIRKTHVAFLGLDRFMGKSLTIMKWKETNLTTGQPKFYSFPPDYYSYECWYENEKLANQLTCAFRWYLMPLQIVPDSESKTYQDQMAMFPKEYEVPFAIEEVTKDLLYHRKNGTPLNPSRYGRCQDVSSNSGRVSIGHFCSDGLGINRWTNDDCRDYDVGLAASRKLPHTITL